MTNEPLRLSSIGQIAQPVTDLERAIEFYRETLGGTLIATFDPPGLAFFDCGGVRLMLDAVPGAMEPPGSPLYFAVDDLDASVATLEESGVTITQEPHMISRDDAGDFGPVGVETWMEFFRDPDGNILVLMTERPPA
jgi:methylmalonyl-CoA/ethylmalonyl-CoA epimerase